MKKYLLLLMIIPTLVLADNVFLVNKTTGEVTDIMSNTAKNFAVNQARVYSDKVGWEVQTGDVPPTTYRKWDGSKVVEDTAKQTTKDFELSIAKQIDAKQKLLAINDLLKTATGTTATELTKQKAELEAKL